MYMTCQESAPKRHRKELRSRLKKGGDQVGEF